MISFRHIDWKEDLIETAISEQRGQNTLFLVPTNLNKKRAVQYYQQDLDFSGDSIQTLEDWKTNLFTAPYPIVKEEKRALSLFKILDEEDRKIFKLSGYFQSIGFINDFFSFWEELTEEQTDIEDVLKVIPGRSASDNWQSVEFKRLLDIRNRYRITNQSGSIKI